jgi:hypothetical protein
MWHNRHGHLDSLWYFRLCLLAVLFAFGTWQAKLRHSRLLVAVSVPLHLFSVIALHAFSTCIGGGGPRHMRCQSSFNSVWRAGIIKSYCTALHCTAILIVFNPAKRRALTLRNKPSTELSARDSDFAPQRTGSPSTSRVILLSLLHQRLGSATKSHSINFQSSRQASKTHHRHTMLTAFLVNENFACQPVHLAVR